MKIFEVIFNFGESKIEFANTRWDIWERYPPGYIANIYRIEII